MGLIADMKGLSSGDIKTLLTECQAELKKREGVKKQADTGAAGQAGAGSGAGLPDVKLP
jgi:hypothetical protein